MTFETGPRLPLAPITDSEAFTETNAKYMQVLYTWAVDFLTQSHAMLGREGAVCPFTKPSLERRLFWAGVDDTRYDKPESLVELMDDMAQRFLELPGEDSKQAVFKVALVVLPNISDYDIIDVAHAELKNRFVSEGLMIGQFYPGCTVGGLWNDDFKPLDAPPTDAGRSPHGRDRLRVPGGHPHLVRYVPAEVRPDDPDVGAHGHRAAPGQSGVVLLELIKMRRK